MKKLFPFVILISVLAILLSSCGYKQNEWISEEKLSKCLIPDFPEIKDNYVVKGDGDIYVKFSKEEYKAYVSGVYEYLKSKNFEYLGTRGELQSSLSGAFNTYLFEPADILEDFYVDGAYRFVYSDGSVEELDDTFRFRILTINTIGLNTTKTIEEDGVNFKYNTVISLRYNSEYPLSGRYVLPELESDQDKTIEWLHSDTHHWYNPEGEVVIGVVFGYGEHVDDNNDDICDVCGYTMIDSPVPTNHFLRNLAGSEWLSEITAADIDEIKIISGAVGVAPGSFSNISTSKDKAVIARIFDEYYWLDTAPIPSEEGILDGGGAVTVRFIQKNGAVKELYINNGNYCDSDDNYFELLYTPKFNDSDNVTKACGFITYIDTGTVYDGNNNRVCEIPIDELEFIHFEENLGEGAFDYPNYVKTQFGTLGFYSKDIFFIVGDDQYYQLVGKDLDELIADATAPKYSLTMNDEEWLYEDLNPSYKAGETVSVKIGIAYDLGYMLFVNGERVMDEAHTDGPYWEFIFTMPESDVVIDFKTYDGFLPDANYAVLIETYWEKIPEADSISVTRYYGEFDSGAIAAMMRCSEYDFTEAVWEEHIEDVVIHYNNGNRIIVLYEGEFYNLTKAYENGYLSIKEITAIAEMHNG